MAQERNGDFFSEKQDNMTIMDLPVEIRAYIFRRIEQRFVPNLRLVCQQWKIEVDSCYDFSLDIADSTEMFDAIYNWRCVDCTVWSIKSHRLNSRELFNNPNHLRKLKIYGVLPANILHRLMSYCENLEYFAISKRAGCPLFLNQNDTPSLKNLTALKHLRLYLGTNIFIIPGDKERSCPGKHDMPNPPYHIPMLDCYFPSLKTLEVGQRCRQLNTASINIFILKFLARHSRTLKDFDMDFRPVSVNPGLVLLSLNDQCVLNQNEEQSLRSIRLKKLGVTTQLSKTESQIWKMILENQNQLRDLQFEWLNCICNSSETRIRLDGFPWTYFRPAITNSKETLTNVSLVGLSMMSRVNGGNLIADEEILPFDVSIFRECDHLQDVTLRCHENHALVHFPIPVQFLEDPIIGVSDEIDDDPLDNIPGFDPVERAYLINGGDLPTSLSRLEIDSLRVFTSDLGPIFQKCINLQSLFLKNCGKSGALGVTANLFSIISRLEKLRNLDICVFNDKNNGESKTELQVLCEIIGTSYEKEDTWVTIDNMCAYSDLACVREHPVLSISWIGLPF